MSVSRVNKLFMNYIQLSDISEIIGMKRKDVLKCIELSIPERAKKSLQAIDLTEYTDELPIMKMIITKLSVIRNELFRRATHDLSILTQAEKVDNMLKKIKVNDVSEWIKSEDIEIIEETGGYVTVNWVFLSETATTKDMVDHAKVLTDKFLMKPDSIYVYHNWDEHVGRCVRLGIDPKQYSEAESQSMANTMDEYMKGVNND